MPLTLKLTPLGALDFTSILALKIHKLHGFHQNNSEAAITSCNVVEVFVQELYMHQLCILCKPQWLLASFEVLEMSEKAGGTDMSTDDKDLIMALNCLVKPKMMMQGAGRQARQVG